MSYATRHQYHIHLPEIDWQRVMLNIRSCGVPLAQLKKATRMDARTSRMTNAQISEVIAFAEAWCAEKGIELSDENYE